MKQTIVLSLLVIGLTAGCGDKKPKPIPAESEPVPAPPAVVDPGAWEATGDPEAGALVYGRICVACHQADGTGMNGMLAASFVQDKARLAKTDEQLLTSIRNGIVADGRVMPPQKDVLSDKEMHDALAYIRKTFAN